MDRSRGLVHEVYDSDRESRAGPFRYFPYPAPAGTGVYSPVYERAPVSATAASRSEAASRGLLSPGRTPDRKRRASWCREDGSLSPREPEPEHERPPRAGRSQLGPKTPVRPPRSVEPETSPESLEAWETEGQSEAESYVPEGVAIFQMDTPNPARPSAWRPLLALDAPAPPDLQQGSPLPLMQLDLNAFPRRGPKANSQLRRRPLRATRRVRIPRPLGRWVDEMFDALVVENLHVHYDHGHSSIRPVKGLADEKGEESVFFRLFAVLPLALLPTLVTFPAAFAVAQSLAAKSGASSMIAILGAHAI